MNLIFIKCEFCEYKTDVKCNMKRHQNAKHKNEMYEKHHKSETCENVISKCENVISKCENVIPKCENVIPEKKYSATCNKCAKCYKEYSSNRYLKVHESKCNKVDSLTCPRCMVSFSNRHNKARHIKANKCVARSIAYARPANSHNITNITNNVQNAHTIQNNNINNKIIINNFGSERIDHITYEDVKHMLQNGMNTLPLYIEKKHFDKRFPENNNIKYTDDNKCKVMEGNLWKEKDIAILSNTLIKNNSEVLLLYCDDKDVKLSDDIGDSDKYEHIKNKLIVIYNKSDNGKYNYILSKIKDLIKNTKDVHNDYCS